MAAHRSVSLPFGLSELYQQNRTMGKVTVLPMGGRARWRISTLEQVSANTNNAPIIDIRRKMERPHKRSRNRRNNESESSGEEEMIPMISDARKRKRTPALAERKHLSKPNAHFKPARTSKAPTLDSEMDPSVARKKPLERGTRTGASEDTPITIDDDDDTLEDDPEAFERPGLFRSSLELSQPTPPFSGIYSPLARTRQSAPAKIRLGSIRGTYAAPPERVANATMERAPSIYIGIAQRSLRDSPTADRLPKSTPSAYKRPSFTQSPHSADVQRRPFGTTGPPISTSIPGSGDQIDMSLGSISDFEMRKKVADLMAVAPALPVRGLYRLLVNLEGDLPAARKEAIRASRAPSINPSIKPETSSVAGDSESFSKLAYDVDGDELMVKIDPNDGFLEWDSDSPTLPDPSQQRTGVKRPSATKSRPRPDASSKKRSINASPRKSTHSTKNRPDISVKKRRSSPSKSERVRGDSDTRSFVVPDNVVYVDTDASSSDSGSSTDTSLDESDSDTEMTRTVPETLDVLRIKMKPKWAYNDGLLVRPRK